MAERLIFHPSSIEPKSEIFPTSSSQLPVYARISVQPDDRKMTFRGLGQPAINNLPIFKNTSVQTLEPLSAHPKITNPFVELIQRVKRESSSKVKDGLIPPIVLLLLTLLYNLIVIPIELTLLMPGLLVLVLLVMALGAIALDRSVQLRFSQPDRAFQGMLAGMFFWFSADLASRLGRIDITSQSSVVFMVLISLIATVLWKSIFPAGIKFFSLIFLLNWVGRYLFLKLFALLAIWNFAFQPQLVYSWISLAGIVILVLWLFIKSASRLQRYGIATAIWFFGLQAAALYWGWII